MIRKYKNIILLLLILLIATFLRFNQISTNPPSLTWDETAWGYNAYALGIDAKDEFGRVLPFDYLESFGDFKPPLYAYLAIIPVKIFGLTEFATRFPSAFFGVLTVLISYFLVKRLFANSENKEKYALFTSLFLAISPWHIMLSRAAFEANIATFFIVTGVYAFLAGIGNKKWYLLVSAFFFAASMYVFNTARIVSPFLVVILSLFYWKRLIKVKTQMILALVLGLVVFLPLFPFLLSPQAGLRYKEVNIFSDSTVITSANQQVANDNNADWSKVIHNRRVLYTLEFFKRYFDNLSPNFLFIRGDGNPKFSVQDVGQLYIWDIVFFVGGAFLLFKKREGGWWLIPVWLLFGIIPAGLARETPHALRIETTLPTFQILVAYGFVNFLNLFKKRQNLIMSVLLILLIGNFIYFYHSLGKHYAIDYSGEWQYGYKESLAYASSVEAKYDNIVITTALGRPYAYHLFYDKVSPEYFRNNSEIERDPFGFVTVKRVGKYLFPGKFDYSLSSKKNVLYINTPYTLPENIVIKKTFNLLNGKTALVAYEYK